MAEPDTTYFESLCEQLYNPKTPEEGEQVRKVLEQSFPIFGDSNNLPTETASSLRLLLSRSPNPFVQTFCLSRIKQLVQAQPNAFSVQVKIQLRTFLLEYAFIHPDLIPFVISQLGNVLAVVTLIGWAEVEEYKNIYKDISQFIQASIDHRIVGLQLLSILVQDMNPPSFTRNSSKYRKAAGEFRDTQLFDICEAAFKTLEEIVEHGIIYTHVNQAERLKEVTLNLLVRCFSYDFSGTSSDESGEDTATIQVPTSWRPLLEKDSFLPTFFKAYSEFEPPYSSKAMECLVQIASIRIALFTEPQRTKFIVAIMQGIRNIIVNTQGLDDGDNYNGFCRFLSRFRATVPLNEMVQTPGYLDWIELIANFSFKAFQSWKFAPNTSSYVLSFWTRLVQSMTYYQQLGEEAIEKLANLTIGIVQAYVSTALEAVPIRIEEGLDDPLENEDALIESLNHLGQIAHKRYQACSTALIELFNSITDQYQELINTVGINVSSEFKEALEVIETKYAWVVYIMGSFIGNRAAFMTSDNVDKIDSEITTKVLQLVDFQQSLLNQNGSTFMNEKLDLAIIFFFQMFKKSYMSESSGRDIYSILSEVFGISHQVTMLDVIMRKIISNLQHWADNETVIRRTLELFNDLNTGYGASKNLRKIEATTFILQNHMSTEIAFCQHEKQHDNRVLYFQILCKLLFADDNITERAFYDFMEPFHRRIEALGSLDTVEAFQQESVKKAIRDIFTDLYGFMLPIQSRRHFTLFFDWFYNYYSSLLLRAVESWSPDPIVNTLLKFYVEYASNKNQRLGFDVSSPNGILIFRDASQIISMYHQQVMKQPVLRQDQVYDYRYKGIILCFDIMSKCLGGKYVNFGILWLYQDKSVNEAIDATLQLIQSIPVNDLMCFPKLSHSFFFLLDELVRERQLMALPHLSPETFLHLMQACEQGMDSSDQLICSHACSAINHIACFAIQETEKSTRQQQRRRSSAQQHWLITYLAQFNHILPTLLAGLFQLLLFDDKSDQWTLSRPLYPLILLQRNYVFKYISVVIEQQPPETRPIVTTVLNGLLDGINWTLTTKDRERFTHNVSSFRKPLNAHSINLTPLTVPPSYY